METTAKTQMTQKDLVEFVQAVANAQTLDNLSEISKKLLAYDMNGYKASIVTMIKSKRREIVDTLLKEKPLFNSFYFLIKTTSGNAFKQVGKLLYSLKDYGVLTKGEVNYLFDIYESRKQKLNSTDLEEDEE